MRMHVCVLMAELTASCLLSRLSKHNNNWQKESFQAQNFTFFILFF